MKKGKYSVSSRVFALLITKKLCVCVCLTDGFGVTGNTGGDCYTESRRLSKEDIRTKEEEQGTWEGKATMNIMTGFAKKFTCCFMYFFNIKLKILRLCIFVFVFLCFLSLILYSCIISIACFSLYFLPSKHLQISAATTVWKWTYLFFFFFSEFELSNCSFLWLFLAIQRICLLHAKTSF